jgi:hypothetical protein
MKTIAALAACYALLCTTESAFGYQYNSCLGHPSSRPNNRLCTPDSELSIGLLAKRDQDTVDKFNRNPSNFSVHARHEVGRRRRSNKAKRDLGRYGVDSPALLHSGHVLTCYWFFGDHVHMDEADVIFDYIAVAVDC